MANDVGRSVPDGLSSATPMEPQASPPKASIPSAVIDIIGALQEVSRNAMFKDGGFGTPYSVAKTLGLIEEHEVQKRCRSCGHPQHDYSYSKLSLAGQAYLALASAIEARSDATAQTGAAVGESAGPKDDAQPSQRAEASNG